MAETQSDANRLGYAWDLIMPAYHKTCVDAAVQHGSGLLIFKLYRQSQTIEDQHANCEFAHLARDSPMWTAAFEFAPNKDSFAAVYDPSVHILVSVHIPAGEHGDDTIGNIRMFSIESGEEVVV